MRAPTKMLPFQRWPDHARCYVCHEVSHHGGGPLTLERLSPGATSWTEEQSRTNFQIVSKLVSPGDPRANLLLLMALAPEVGGIADTHQGGRQFTSQDDPTLRSWRRGFAGKKQEVPPRDSRQGSAH
jgi:hypothetical protein